MSWRVSTSEDAATSFSPDYRAARTRFRDAAERLGWACDAYPIGTAGPEGEELAIDVAASSPDATPRVLVISSGLHGVEGFLGSAIQLAMLERWRRQPDPPKGLRCVMLHALNPYGFAWSRRCDADNIDPNRNFLLEGIEYRGSSEAYARLDGLLNPRRPPSRWDLFYLRACWALARHGRPALEDAVVAGQYDFPAGLFFGGSGPSCTRRILQQHMRSWIGGATSVVHLDLHTGLGAWGTYRLLTDDTPSPEQRNWIARTFGPGAHEEGDSRGVAYQARGSLGRWCRAQNFAPEYLLAYAEFGTYGNLRALAGLRAENQAHHWGRAQDRGTLRAKARLQELFCPASSEWRTRALAQGTELVEKAIGGMLGIPLDSA